MQLGLRRKEDVPPTVITGKDQFRKAEEKSKSEEGRRSICGLSNREGEYRKNSSNDQNDLNHPSQMNQINETNQMDEINQRTFSSRNLSVSNPGLIVSKFPDLFLCFLISLKVI